VEGGVASSAESAVEVDKPGYVERRKEVISSSLIRKEGS
jgi:hypothetical protein